MLERTRLAEGKCRFRRVNAHGSTRAIDLFVDEPSVGRVNARHTVNRQWFLRNVYDERDWRDKAMYTGIGRITGYGWPAFVGSPETVADALLDYHDLGVRVFGVGMSVDAKEDQDLAWALFGVLRAGVGARDLAAKRVGTS